MKNLISLSLFILFVLQGCDTKMATNHCITLVVDLTNPNAELPSTEKLKQYIIPYLQNTSNGIEVSLVYITDVHRNKKKTLVLPSFSNGFFSSELERKMQTNTFEKELDVLLSDIYNQRKGYEQSHIFRAVNREITDLNNHKSNGNKQLILVSDLEQSNAIFSVYKNQDLEKLNNPRKLAEYLGRKMSIPTNLHPIEIHFVHQPNNESENLYDALLTVYRYLYGVRGATLIADIETKTRIQ